MHVPPERLPACWLWPVIERLTVYPGVLRARAEAEKNRSQPTPRTSQRPASSAPSKTASRPQRVVRPAQDFRPDDPLLAGKVETSHWTAGSTSAVRGS